MRFTCLDTYVSDRVSLTAGGAILDSLQYWMCNDTAPAIKHASLPQAVYGGAATAVCDTKIHLYHLYSMICFSLIHTLCFFTKPYHLSIQWPLNGSFILSGGIDADGAISKMVICFDPVAAVRSDSLYHDYEALNVSPAVRLCLQIS